MRGMRCATSNWRLDRGTCMDGTKTLSDRRQTWLWLTAGGALSLATLLLLFLRPPPQESLHAAHHEHELMSMPMAELTPARQAKLLADKSEREFNHHLAGFFLVLAGDFILLQSPRMERWRSLKYVGA